MQTMSEILFKFLLTTLSCEPKGDKVEFPGDIRGKIDEVTVSYLVDVIDTGRTTDRTKRKIFEAIKVSREDFRERLMKVNKKIFLAVHGFSTEPEKWMVTCKEIQDYKQEGTSKTFPRQVIPIIWPCIGDSGIIITVDYDREQRMAKEVGKIFSNVGDGEIFKNLPVSLMSHSMGNRAIFSYALSYAKDLNEIREIFDHIFMVSADVWEEVFNTRIVEKKSRSWSRTSVYNDAGLKLSKMVKKDNGGKIHVLHYKKDIALKASFWENGGRTRLGVYGIEAQLTRGRLHADIKDVIQDYDMSSYVKEIKEVDWLCHSYQSSSAAIDYYMKDEFN